MQSSGPLLSHLVFTGPQGFTGLEWLMDGFSKAWDGRAGPPERDVCQHCMNAGVCMSRMAGGDLRDGMGRLAWPAMLGH